jgi:hypothetical protein
MTAMSYLRVLVVLVHVLLARLLCPRVLAVTRLRGRGRCDRSARGLVMTAAQVGVLRAGAGAGGVPVWMTAALHGRTCTPLGTHRVRAL